MAATRHPASLPEKTLLADVEQRRFKHSGPGGQRRNKVETAVRLIHRPSGVTAAATERRSLEQNRRMALLRLRRALALALRTEVDLTGYEPSGLWRRRTSGTGLSVNRRHADVPSLLAEALDVLAALDDDLVAAALVLGVSSSRLVKLLKLEPEALRGLNARLAAAGRPTWR